MAKTRTGKPSSITILIHGTFSRRIGFWHRPGSPLHRHIKRHVFSDVYCGRDFFDWSGKATDGARSKAATELIKWCNDHPAEQYNIIAHSHGCSVASIATNNGLTNINKLVYLSPVVWAHREGDGYIPDMNSVSHDVFFNFHAQKDIIVTRVARPPGLQSFEDTSVGNFEEKFEIAPRGHWAPVLLFNWIEDDIGEIIDNDDLFE